MEARCQACGSVIHDYQISNYKYCDKCKERYGINDEHNREERLEKNREYKKVQPVYTYNDIGERVEHSIQTDTKEHINWIGSKIRYKTCAVCGKEFTSASGGEKYCSDTCRKQAAKERNTKR